MTSSIIFRAGLVESFGYPVVQADTNLNTLFDCLPLPNKPVFRGSAADRTVQIRNWMDRSQNVLDQIKELDLSSKNLSAIPPEMERLRNLESLNLFDNKITTLQHLPVNLNGLVVRRNQLENIDNVIWPNTLKWLDLEANQITSLDNAHLPRLQCLFLDWNQITSLDEAALPPELEMLSIVNTPLTSIRFVNQLSAFCSVLSGRNRFSPVDVATLERREQQRRALLQQRNDEQLTPARRPADDRFPNESSAMGG